MKVLLTRVSVIMTVKNDPDGCAETIGALLAQDRLPDEIVIADGGSEDATIGILRRLESTFSLVTVVDAPGANIARGRNIAASASCGDVLAFTDAGCLPVPSWLAELVRPIEKEHADFVAGAYRVVGDTLFEKVVGSATMRGQLEPVSPETFNPSARSMACTRRLWAQVAGFPEWLAYSEDTLFDHKVRASGCHWKFAPQAIVEWRPRGTLLEVGRQFFRYGTGRGHTQIGAADFA
jgi:glycosyltransferase involved in cell wall biosynthesis